MPADVDLSEFVQLSLRKRKQPPCQVAIARSGLPAEEQEKLDAAASHENITAGAIQAWFSARGLELSIPGVTAHRKQKCACYS